MKLLASVLLLSLCTISCSTGTSKSEAKSADKGSKNNSFTGTQKGEDANGYAFSIEYVNGKKNGEAKRYFKNGEVYKLSTYKEDVLNGPAITYNRQGKVLVEKYYKAGRLDSTLTRYFKTGKVKFQSDYVLDRPLVGYTFTDYTGKEAEKPKMSFEIQPTSDEEKFDIVISIDQNLNNPELYLLENMEDWSKPEFQHGPYRIPMLSNNSAVIQEQVAKGYRADAEYYFFLVHKPNKKDKAVVMQRYDLQLVN